ncbi:S-layer homology domain-containing protein [Sporosalibacterium faouarense]|uniref:S-layer homology domain-containing protein n=1 Tax=Sporosalibacterium faouarense TaxID=516123 RepID=UPI00192B204F|nr:S-layer homology domain-containing protein [Sporosalibacterium faouarense]
MRKKKIVTLLVVVFILISSINFTAADDIIFYMDTFDHWAFDTIMWVSNEVKLFNGYEDGTFKPDNNVSRSEYITLLYRAAKLQGLIDDVNSNSTPLYSDVTENYWAYDKIMAVVKYINMQDSKLKFQDIFPGNKLQPNKKLTREEAIILSSYFTSPSIREDKVIFKDIRSSYKYYDQLNKLVSNRIIEGYDDNSFRPRNNITRAETAVILKKLYLDMEYLKGKYLQNIELLNMPKYRKYMLFGDYGGKQLSIEDKLYRRAISTLEYISIIHYIPYEEKHLYDSNPIQTLKDLRNSGYWNTLGVNYYLITEGNNNGNIDVLYDELLENYINRTDIRDEETLLIFDIDINKLKSTKNTIAALDKWMKNSSTEEGKFNALFIKSKVYLENKEFQKAINVYEEIFASNKESIKDKNKFYDEENASIDINQSKEEGQLEEEKSNIENVNPISKINDEIKKVYIMNKAFVFTKVNKYNEAEKALRDCWEEMKTDEFDEDFIGALKEVIILQSNYNSNANLPTIKRDSNMNNDED